ncbi:histidine phosphotransferase HPT1p [Tolypocladium capitatum]|uniref:Histidine phosphotransferase HPT1p n=1 Tax=Tolypocladium capitatum TaxID=45235 RepID=A0A2K3QCE9_9HYPO|nr:histidine phosphotransferase HPT1p [Tolypocladium capitatum]
MAPAENKTTANEGVETGLGDAVDMDTFNQILEMDDPGDHEFSSSLVFGFFEQVEETFESMDTALAKKDLDQLSQLGHFLKGSSATLGLVKVRDGCEKIQRYGKNENVDGSAEPDSELCLKRIREALITVKTDYQDVERTLKRYYEKSDKDMGDDD